MGKPAARLTDMHTCPMVTPGLPPIPHVGGPIVSPGVPTVLIGFLPAATVGDMCVCVGPPDTIAMGSPTVFIGNKMAARMGDPTVHGGVIVVGCPTVLIGEMGSGGAGGGGGGGGGSLSNAAESDGESSTNSGNQLGSDDGEACEIYSGGIGIEGSAEFRKKTRKALDELSKTKSGKEIIEKLAQQGKAGKGVIIKPGKLNGCARDNPADALAKKTLRDPKTNQVIITENGKGSSSTISFNPDFKPTYPDGTPCRPPSIALGHELIHGIHNGDGENLREVKDASDKGLLQGSNHEEARTIGRGAYEGTSPTDNSLRKEMGYKERDSHGSVCP